MRIIFFCWLKIIFTLQKKEIFTQKGGKRPIVKDFKPQKKIIHLLLFNNSIYLQQI